jgi:Subtilase family
VTHRLLAATFAAAALSAAAASPALAARTAAAGYATPPDRGPTVLLPGDASAASADADPAHWLVGSRSPAARPLAARYGARALAGGMGYVVPVGKARAFAAALRGRGLLSYAEPDRYRKRYAVVDDPLSGTPNAWRRVVADPAIDPPGVTLNSPLIALVDAELDPAHPEFQGGNVATLGGLGVTNLHGTATAAVAVAPKNNIGILGVWPGARALNIPLPERILCSSSADDIDKAVAAGAAVINMSYGSAQRCETEANALENAVAHGVIPVAAAGNEGEKKNPREFPASLPHVLTVAAIGPDGKSTSFSNRNSAVDLSAPGIGIMTAVPPALDDDGTQDGYELLSGTSFSAPMVSAAVAWVRQARPELTPDQVAHVVRRSATDLGKKGWDVNTGWGGLSVGNALSRVPAATDPLEPNEDVMWVNGSRIPKAPFVFSGKGRARLAATVDRAEDPRDVYRIKLPAHSRAKVIVKPAFGNPQVQVFTSAARTVIGTGRHRETRSRHSSSRTERVSIRNRGGKSHVYYVVVGVQSARQLDAGYGMTVKR